MPTNDSEYQKEYMRKYRASKKLLKGSLKNSLQKPLQKSLQKPLQKSFLSPDDLDFFTTLIIRVTHRRQISQEESKRALDLLSKL